MLRLAAIVVLASLTCLGLAAQPPGGLHWQRDEAMRAAFTADTGSSRNMLLGLAETGSTMELLAALKAIANRADWPAPARERVLFEFTRDLRSMPPGSVAQEVMDFLRSHQPQVLVPHEDHPRAAVPLFNVSASAHGAGNAWQRQDWSYRGSSLLVKGPEQFVAAYEAATQRPLREGLLDALDTATAGQLEVVCRLALAALERDPDLTTLAGRAALLNRDAGALALLVRKGSGAALAPALRGAAELLDPVELLGLLEAVLIDAPPDSAAIAIATLTPVLQGHAPVTEMLLGLLGDQRLGAPAALALAKIGDTGTLQRLDEMANPGDHSLVAVRARLALRINRTRIAAESPE